MQDKSKRALNSILNNLSAKTMGVVLGGRPCWRERERERDTEGN